MPFYQTVTNRLAWLLSHRTLRTMSYPLTKLKQQLYQVKDTLGLKVLAVYIIPCECGAKGKIGKCENYAAYTCEIGTNGEIYNCPSLGAGPSAMVLKKIILF